MAVPWGAAGYCEEHFRCCNTLLCSDPSLGASLRGDDGGFICGEYGCMRANGADGDPALCLTQADGSRHGACQPTDSCTGDGGDMRASMITCAARRCYVPYTAQGASKADVLRLRK